MKLDVKKFSSVVTQRIDENYKVIETVTIDVAADFKVKKHDLQRELRDVSGLQAWYGQLKEMAHAMMKRANYKRHVAYERRADKIRDGNPKMTETTLKVKAHRSPKVLASIEEYMLWRDRHRMLSMLHEAMRDRHQTLRTLEATERNERNAS